MSSVRTRYPAQKKLGLSAPSESPRPAGPHWHSSGCRLAGSGADEPAMKARLSRLLLLAAPVAVLATMLPLYRILAATLGARRGYLLGFAIYWIGWCLAVPLWILGWSGLVRLFARQEGA